MADGKCNKLSQSAIREFQERVIDWYRRCGRKFYWRTHALDCWQWLVLELLLKRTKAETVEKRFPQFIAKYSNPKVVVEASNSELESDLKYLGLYRQRRAALKLIADKILSGYGGKVPSDLALLSSIPHVGLYISNAVLCFCYGKRRPVVDSNVARVLTRLCGLDMPEDTREQWIWGLAENMLPKKEWKEYNFGLLDLGATSCRNRPKCTNCCLSDICKYRLVS